MAAGHACRRRVAAGVEQHTQSPPIVARHLPSEWLRALIMSLRADGAHHPSPAKHGRPATPRTADADCERAGHSCGGQQFIGQVGQGDFQAADPGCGLAPTVRKLR